MEPELKKDNANKTKAVAFTLQDWLALAGTLALSAMVVYGFAGWSRLPGLGVTVFTFSGAALTVWRLRGNLRVFKGAVFTVVCALLLALTYALFANEEMRLMNLPVLTAALLTGLYALSSSADALPHGPRALVSLAVRAIKDSVRHMDKPFRGAAALKQDQHKHLKNLGLGLLIAVPVLAVALRLLSSADEVFSDGLSKLLKGLSLEQGTGAAINILLTLGLGLMLFSLIWGIRQPVVPVQDKKTVSLPVLTAAVVLGALIAAYALFVWVQVNYLFGGAKSAAMAGGWAQYARKGFFELVFIGALNIGLMSLTLKKGQRSLLLRLLNGALIFLSALMLLSAARRMILYIEAFGFSLLRLITLWAMAMILSALAAFTVRLLHPDARLFRPLAALALASWVGLNLLSPAALVANWNAKAFIKGSLRSVDTNYLASLGADALPALRRLSENGSMDAAEAIRDLHRRGPSSWYAWSLSETQLVQNTPDKNSLTPSEGADE